jgi:hypothetical protein
MPAAVCASLFNSFGSKRKPVPPPKPAGEAAAGKAPTPEAAAAEIDHS